MDRTADQIDTIVFHCSASDIFAHNNISIIDRWHKRKGWRMVGYHSFIQNNGTVQRGREELDYGAHVYRHNRNTIGICLSGNKIFTDAQFDSAAKEACRLMKKYKIKIENILGHNHFTDKKTCPNFDMNEIISRICLIGLYDLK